MQRTKELTVFKFNDKVIRRSNGVDGRILYCIADVCAALGIKKTNEVVNRLTRGAVNNASLSREGVGNNAPLSHEEVDNNASLAANITLVDYPTTGGVQRMVYTDEVGLYDIIGKSRKPLAKILFRKLIEAVPSMRQEMTVTEVVPNLDLASIKALAQGIIGLTGHVEVIQTDVNLLKTDVALLKTTHESNALLPVVQPLTRRNEIIVFIDKYMAKHPWEFNDFEDIWNHLYDVFRYRTKRDIKREARNSGYKSVLEYVEYVGEIDRLWVVARDLFDR
ncbi:MAG: BRO family protein [Chloroflexi bacterium]|nr:BRO family protein [Chloroflexota bacterium]